MFKKKKSFHINLITSDHPGFILKSPNCFHTIFFWKKKKIKIFWFEIAFQQIRKITNSFYLKLNGFPVITIIICFFYSVCDNFSWNFRINCFSCCYYFVVNYFYSHFIKIKSHIDQKLSLCNWLIGHFCLNWMDEWIYMLAWFDGRHD